MLKTLKLLYRLIKYRSIILGEVNLGDGVWIRYSYIKGNVDLASGSTIFRANIVGNVKLEQDCSITGPFTYLQSKDRCISIGARSAIAPGTLAITGGHDRNVKHKSFKSGGIATEEDINVGADVWIGAGSILLGGCVVQDNVTAAAGAILKKGTYYADHLYAGVPAKEK